MEWTGHGLTAPLIARGLARSQPAGQPEGLRDSGWLCAANGCRRSVRRRHPRRVFRMGVNIVHGPARSTTDTRGQNGPQDTSSPPLRVLTRQWVVRLERCPAWQVLRRLLRCSPAERALGFQSAIPRSRNSGKSAWLGQGPPLGVSPPCGPMLRHNKVGQTVQVRADWRRHLVDGKLFDVWRRVVPAIWSCFLIRFGAATFSGPLGGCRRSCGIMNRMYAKVSSVLHNEIQRPQQALHHGGVDVETMDLDLDVQKHVDAGSRSQQAAQRERSPDSPQLTSILVEEQARDLVEPIQRRYGDTRHG